MNKTLLQHSTNNTYHWLACALLMATLWPVSAAVVRTGGLTPGQNEWYHIHVQGSAAYVEQLYDSHTGAELRSINVSSPSAPTQQGSSGILTIIPSTFYGSVTVSGSRAYACSSAGLKVVDLQLPFTPLQVGTWDWVSGGSSTYLDCLTASGNYVFIGGRLMSTGYKLLVVDATQAANLQKVAELSLPAQARSIKVAGNRAYLAMGSSGVLIVDISQPTNPQILGQCVTSYAYEVAVGTDKIFVADGAYMRVIDVSDPSIPTIIGSYRVDTSVESISTTANASYVVIAETSTTSPKLTVVNVSNPGNITAFASAIPNHYSSQRICIAVQGDYAYVSEGSDGLEIFKLNVPTPVTPLPTLSACMFSGLFIAGTNGAMYQIQATTSMDNPNWTTVDTVTMTNNNQYWIDTRYPVKGACYYRALTN